MSQYANDFHQEFRHIKGQLDEILAITLAKAEDRQAALTRTCRSNVCSSGIVTVSFRPIENKKPYARNGFLVIAMFVVIGVAFYPSFVVAKISERPFKAAFTALPAGGIAVAGGGTATHLGKFGLEIFRQGASDPSPSDPCVGFQIFFAALTAANGDELWMNYTDGEICFDFTNFPVVGAVNLIGVGGTDRFTDSTGDYQMYWSGEISPDGVVNSGEIEGVIGY